MLKWIVMAAFGVTVPIAITGCTEMNRLSPNEKINAEHDSVFILGLAPSKHRILIFMGSMKNGVWQQNPWATATFMGTAKDGYVLATASPGHPYAITSIVVLKDEGDLRGDAAYLPCGEAETLVFSVPRGKVLYLTDLNFVKDGDHLRLTYSTDLQRAQTYIDQNYPALKGRTEAGSFEFSKTDAMCAGNGRTPIMIFVPARR